MLFVLNDIFEGPMSTNVFFNTNAVISLQDSKLFTIALWLRAHETANITGLWKKMGEFHWQVPVHTERRRRDLIVGPACVHLNYSRGRFQ